MKTIKIFSEVYYPDLISSGYYMTEISETLAKDHDVTVFCGGTNTKFHSEVRNKVKIVRFPLKNFNKNILYKRIIKFIHLSWKFYLIARKQIGSNDEVICVTNPALFIPIISYLKKRRNFILTFFIHDVFPDNLVATQILSSNNLIYKLLYKIYRLSFYRANRIVTCGRDMKQYFELKLPNYNGEILSIPNWGDPKNICPNLALKKQTLHEFGITARMVFQFAGNIGRGQGITCLLQAATEVNHPDIQFLFFGEGVYEEKLKSMSTMNITYGGSFTRDESNKFLNACDVAIVSLQKGMYGLGVPSKTYNILAAGKPILYIGEAKSEIGLLIQEYGLGRVCSSGNIESIKEGINWFLERSPAELSELGQKSRTIAENNFSRETITDFYSTIFRTS